MSAYTKHKTFKLEKGLTLEERVRETTLKARAHIRGKSHYLNTETTDFDRASRQARSWFFRLRDDHIPGSREHVTMHAAAKAFIADIRNKPKREYYEEKWSAISEFFKGVDVDAVDSPRLMKFMRYRSKASASTLKKDFVTIRQVLRHAIQEGQLSALPLFPRVESDGTKPNPWFSHAQWQHLLDVAQERLEDAMEEAGGHRHERQDLLDFLRLQVATCMRVDELRSVKVKDVQIRLKDPLAYQKIHFEYDARGRMVEGQPPPNEYLEIELQLPDDGELTKGRLKRGVRTIVTRPALSGVQTFRERVAREGLKPNDLLFPVHVREGFVELLLAAKLRMAGGIKRNLKGVRCTGLMFWILAEPNVNLKLLALNAGTSVLQLDVTYLKPLNVKMNRAALVG